MAEEETEKEGKPAKGSGLLMQGVMALVLGGVAFATVYFLPATGNSAAGAACLATDAGNTKGGETLIAELSLDELGFVEMEPMIITLGEDGSARTLRIGVTLETAKDNMDDVTYATPKLRDAFTGYLRAVELSDIEDPNSMVRIRAQLLRRAHVILGNQTVRSVLITDFVIR